MKIKAPYKVIQYRRSLRAVFLRVCGAAGRCDKCGGMCYGHPVWYRIPLTPKRPSRRVSSFQTTA